VQIGALDALSNRGGEVLDPNGLELVVTGPDDGNDGQRPHHREQQGDDSIARTIDIPWTQDDPSAGEAAHDILGAPFRAVIG
jgi:hypothetical protein